MKRKQKRFHLWSFWQESQDVFSPFRKDFISIFAGWKKKNGKENLFIKTIFYLHVFLLLDSLLLITNIFLALLCAPRNKFQGINFKIFTLKQKVRNCYFYGFSFFIENLKEKFQLLTGFNDVLKVEFRS